MGSHSRPSQAPIATLFVVTIVRFDFHTVSSSTEDYAEAMKRARVACEDEMNVVVKVDAYHKYKSYDTWRGPVGQVDYLSTGAVGKTHADFEREASND